MGLFSADRLEAVRNVPLVKLPPRNRRHLAPLPDGCEVVLRGKRKAMAAQCAHQGGAKISTTEKDARCTRDKEIGSERHSQDTVACSRQVAGAAGRVLHTGRITMV